MTNRGPRGSEQGLDVANGLCPCVAAALVCSCHRARAAAAAALAAVADVAEHQGEVRWQRGLAAATVLWHSGSMTRHEWLVGHRRATLGHSSD